MSLPVVASTVILVTLVVLAAVWVRSEMKAAARRRERREQYRRAGQVTGRAPPLDVDDPGGSISSERAKRITADAAETAAGVVAGKRAEPGNPHPVGSREFVLWEATYLSVMSDFVDLHEEQGGSRKQVD